MEAMSEDDKGILDQVLDAMTVPSKPEFISFGHIYRLMRDCIITEKIDGTNGCVYVPEDDGPIIAGSRTRWLDLNSGKKNDDNHGFGKWVDEHKDELRKLGPGRHFGEWWGPGIQRGYGLKERKFSLFNVSRWDDSLRDQVKYPIGRPECVDVVPILYRGDFSTDVVRETLKNLEVDGSSASPGFMRPEGVVVFLPASSGLFKVTLGGDGHKSGRQM